MQELEILSSALANWGYGLLFVSVVVEGPLATLAGGALAATGVFEMYLALPVIISGNLAADLGWYTIGATGRFALAKQSLPGLKGFEKPVDGLLIKIRNHPLKIVATSKLWFGLAAIPALVAAGMAHVPLRKLLLVMLGCEIVWSGLLFTSGTVFWKILPSLVEKFQRLSSVGAVMFFVVLGLLSLHKLTSIKHNRKGSS